MESAGLGEWGDDARVAASLQSGGGVRAVFAVDTRVRSHTSEADEAALIRAARKSLRKLQSQRRLSRWVGGADREGRHCQRAAAWQPAPLPPPRPPPLPAQPPPRCPCPGRCHRIEKGELADRVLQPGAGEVPFATRLGTLLECAAQRPL